MTNGVEGEGFHEATPEPFDTPGITAAVQELIANLQTQDNLDKLHEVERRLLDMWDREKTSDAIISAINAIKEQIRLVENAEMVSYEDKTPDELSKASEDIIDLGKARLMKDFIYARLHLDPYNQQWRSAYAKISRVFSSLEKAAEAHAREAVPFNERGRLYEQFNKIVAGIDVTEASQND